MCLIWSVEILAQKGFWKTKVSVLKQSYINNCWHFWILLSLEQLRITHNLTAWLRDFTGVRRYAPMLHQRESVRLGRVFRLSRICWQYSCSRDDKSNTIPDGLRTKTKTSCRSDFSDSFQVELEPEEFVLEKERAMKKVLEFVALAREGNIQRQKFFHDRNLPGKEFNLLDRVYLKNDKPRVGVSKKLKFRFDGVYTIVAIFELRSEDETTKL